MQVLTGPDFMRLHNHGLLPLRVRLPLAEAEAPLTRIICCQGTCSMVDDAVSVLAKGRGLFASIFDGASSDRG